jgi:hypothetical protein
LTRQLVTESSGRGSMKNRLSLHDVETGKRLCQNARVEDTRFLTYNSFR